METAPLETIQLSTYIFKDILLSRMSYWGFSTTPVPSEIITSVLEDAQQAPSNCNTQHCEMHIVSGDKLKKLSEALLSENKARRFSPDYSFDVDEYHGHYKERYFNLGKTMYEAFDVKHDDKEGRKKVSDPSYKFFNAPHLAIPFMRSSGDNVGVAADVGMYAQTFLLSLTAHGLAGIPQTALGFFAGTIKEILDVPSEFKMLFGISFGYEEPNAPRNSFKLGNTITNNNVTFHQ